MYMLNNIARDVKRPIQHKALGKAMCCIGFKTSTHSKDSKTYCP